MDKPNPLSGRPSGPIDPPESHGPVTTLTRPCRTETEAREGRRARAELDLAIIDLGGFGLILLSKDTAEGFGGMSAPGRFVLMESTRDDPVEPEWVAFWQNAQTAVIDFVKVHRAFACALEDIARRHRAERLSFVPGYQR